jgi:hypothetical protein
VSKKDWHAVADLPGDRIFRRVTGRRSHEFVDEKGQALGRREQTTLWVGPTNYRLTRGGLEPADTDGILIGWPRYPRRREPLPPWGRGLLIDLPNRPPLILKKIPGAFSATWNVAKIFDQSGETLITMRWTPETRSLWSSALPGEVVLAPRQTRPVEPTLFGCYDLEAFDRVH